MPELDLAVVMPVYNEEGSIGTVVEAWAEVLDGLGIRYEIHVFNDGSRDRTAEFLEKLAGNVPGLRVHSKPNSGHGSTCTMGYLGLYSKAEWLFQIDSDNEMGPEWFAKLWSMTADHDFIVGRRFKRQSPLARNLISLVARLTVNMLYGSCIYDVNVPYRLMRTEKFGPCYESIPRDTFAPNLLVTGFAAIHDLKTVEIHIPHRCRATGEVSIRSWKLARESLRSIFQTVGYRFTGLPGAT